MVPDGGSVGIGTTTPGAKLDVEGDILVDGVGTFGVFTVGTLPLASSFPGGRAFVTDAITTPTFAAAATAGGSTYAPVYSTGSAWIYG